MIIIKLCFKIMVCQCCEIMNYQLNLCLFELLYNLLLFLVARSFLVRRSFCNRPQVSVETVSWRLTTRGNMFERLPCLFGGYAVFWITEVRVYWQFFELLELGGSWSGHRITRKKNSFCRSDYQEQPILSITTQKG